MLLLIVPHILENAHVSPQVVTGIAAYVVGITLLDLWEEHVVPELQLRSILPEVRTGAEQLSVKEKRISMLTPMTADRRVPFPLYEELQQQDCCVGKGQFLSADVSLRQIKHVQEHSPDWSEYYGHPIVIYKKRRWK